MFESLSQPEGTPGRSVQILLVALLVLVGGSLVFAGVFDSSPAEMDSIEDLRVMRSIQPGLPESEVRSRLGEVLEESTVGTERPCETPVPGGVAPSRKIMFKLKNGLLVWVFLGPDDRVVKIERGGMSFDPAEIWY